jgi:PTS system nitrogen regulatory IIA component
MSSLTKLLGPEQIVDIDSSDRDSVLRALADCGAANAEIDADALFAAIRERESLCSTGFGDGVAMPHVRLAGVSDFHCVLGRTRAGVEFGAVDGKPVHLLLLVVGPMAQKDGYQKVMARAARFLKAEAARVSDAEDLVTAAQAALTDY